MQKTHLLLLFLFATASSGLYAQGNGVADSIEDKTFNPGTLLWYTNPVSKWEEALPVGNGRLGAMVFGKTDEERIQLNEETYQPGGPYSTECSGKTLHES
jgi:alpha-L-fucosidase 2